MKVLGWILWSVFALLATLILEVLLAMAVYIYLNLNHPTFFGSLVQYARTGLEALNDGLNAAAPGFATQANASLLGEFAPKAFLLLVLGLFASGVIRMIAWSFRRMVFGRG